MTIVLPIRGEYSVCRTVSGNDFTFCFIFGEGLRMEAAMDSAHTSSD